MSRKQREREREQQRKERKRDRVDSLKARTVEEQAADATMAQVATEIADQLGETEDEPRAMIARTVKYLGTETCAGLAPGDAGDRGAGGHVAARPQPAAHAGRGVL